MMQPREDFVESAELHKLERLCAKAEYAFAQSLRAGSRSHIERSAEALLRVTQAFEDQASLEGRQFQRASDATEVIPDPARISDFQEYWRAWTQTRGLVSQRELVGLRLRDRSPRKSLALAKGVLVGAGHRAGLERPTAPARAIESQRGDPHVVQERRLFESEQRLAAAARLVERHPHKRAALIELQAAVITYEFDFEALKSLRASRGKPALIEAQAKLRSHMRSLIEGRQSLERWIERGAKLASKGRTRVRTLDPHHRSVVASATAMQAVHDGLQRALSAREARLEMQLSLQERQYAELARRMLKLERDPAGGPEHARAELQERFMLERIARTVEQLDLYRPLYQSGLVEQSRELPGRAPGAWHREVAVEWAALPARDVDRAVSGAGRSVQLAKVFYSGVMARLGRTRVQARVL